MWSPFRKICVDNKYYVQEDILLKAVRPKTGKTFRRRPFHLLQYATRGAHLIFGSSKDQNSYRKQIPFENETITRFLFHPCLQNGEWSEPLILCHLFMRFFRKETSNLYTSLDHYSKAHYLHLGSLSPLRRPTVSVLLINTAAKSFRYGGLLRNCLPLLGKGIVSPKDDTLYSDNNALWWPWMSLWTKLAVPNCSENKLFNKWWLIWNS